LRMATEPGAGFSALEILFRDANTGAGQSFTDLAAAVQLRLRVASHFQLAERASRFLPWMARFKNFNTAASSGRKPREELEPLLPFHSSSPGINEPSR